MKKINKDSPIPKYYQLKEILREMIENEELKPGEAIPTEMELCQYHNVSRMTARKAIQDLVYQGLLYKEQGKGTYVAYPKERRNVFQLLSFTEEMKANGKQVDNQILLFEKKVPNKRESEILEIDNSINLIYVIKRLRIVDGLPLAIEMAHIPEKVVPGLARKDIEEHSLYGLIEKKYGIKLSYGKQSIQPVVLTSYEGDLMNINLKDNNLGLLFERITYSEDDEAIEYTKSIYRSDIYKLEYTLKR